MKKYSNVISLTHNKRGVYSLDPSIGCSSGLISNPLGCYSDCYAARSGMRYGYDFSKTIYRDFTDENHRQKICLQISRVKLDFIRMGTSGDPSENWAHTLNIIDKVKNANKHIVIITKHWTNLTDNQLIQLSLYNICINTSVSALDNEEIRLNALTQYERIKPFCKSILRTVTASFNLDNKLGLKYNNTQNELLKIQPNIETVLRLSSSNDLIIQNIVNVDKIRFLAGKTIASKRKKSIYFDKCSTCLEQCGLGVKNGYLSTKGIYKQLQLI